MYKTRKFWLVAMLVALLTVGSFMVSADSSSGSSTKKPEIKSISLLSNEGNPQIEIKGANFGKDPSKIKVMLYDNGVFAKILKIKGKKIIAELPSGQICTGNINIRVAVDGAFSNVGELPFSAGSPMLNKIEPTTARVGSLVQLSAVNLGCDPDSDVVTINDRVVPVEAINGNKLSIRVPEDMAAGSTVIKLSVNGHASQGLPLLVEAAPTLNNLPAPDSRLSYINSGTPGSAGFEPLFRINDLWNGINIWDPSFAGTHQFIVNCPWRTSNGKNQIALVTLNFGHSNSLAGNRFGEWEKFVYCRINYPRLPTQPYDSDTNPFWWGASSLCTEHLPHGEVYYNSEGAGTGGMDSYSVSRTLPGQNRFALTMTLVAPDMGNYEDYGRNYANAGGGILPKVTTLVMSFDKTDARMPAAVLNFGNVTLIDESGGNPPATTTNTRVYSDTIHVSGQPQL